MNQRPIAGFGEHQTQDRVSPGLVEVNVDARRVPMFGRKLPGIEGRELDQIEKPAGPGRLFGRRRASGDGRPLVARPLLHFQKLIEDGLALGERMPVVDYDLPGDFIEPGPGSGSRRRSARFTQRRGGR
jgi:hypothetical protein